MRAIFITDPLDPSDGFFSPNRGEIFDFFPAAGEGVGSPFLSASPLIPPAQTPTLPAEAVQAEAAQNGSGGPGSVVAETSSSGFTINLIFDAAAMAAPASFRSGIEQAASLLSATITNKITVNIDVDYRGTGGGAAAGPDNGLYENYSTVRADLINNAAPGDTTFNALPTGSTIQGQSQVAVWNAQLKLFGLISPNSTTTDDGSATFATDIDPSLLVGVALHELTHALGRVPYGSQPDIFDFYRFTSPGVRLFSDSIPSSAAYFSVDGGNTKLVDLGQSSDPSDFLNSGMQGPNDPFNEYYTGSTSQTLTTVDKEMLDALGFNTASQSLDVPGDLTGAGASDILWYSPSNANVGYWTVNGSTAQWTSLGAGSTTMNVAGIGDFNGDGTSDILWQNPTNSMVGDWLMNNGAPTWQLIGQGPTTMNIAGVGDFSGNGTSDILWQNPTNNLVGEWQMSNNSPTWELVGQGSTTMNIAGIGDFNGDGRSDILWENQTNNLVGIWGMNGAQATWSLIGQGSTTMQIVGVGDFTGNGTDDILWENPSNGVVGFWGMNKGQVASWNVIGAATTGYQVAGTGDYYGNGTDDILWRNPSTGDTGVWAMNNGQATWHDLGLLSTAFNVVKG
jgi:hypothetical protein